MLPRADCNYGTTAGNYTSSVDVGNKTEYQLHSLPLTQGVTYYFSVTAYNSSGESDCSEAISWIPSNTTPADTTPPDRPKWEPNMAVTSPWYGLARMAMNSA